MYKVLITGAEGMLGWDTARAFESSGHKVVACGRRQLDITLEEGTLRAVQEIKPHVIINCAAFTKVDECETDTETALLVNFEGARNIAQAAAKTGAYLIHISTDYVFDGTSARPYRESDPVCPINVYGLSKLKGEEAVAAVCKSYAVVRTSWLFGTNGPNFIKTILRLAGKMETLSVVNDQRGSPTFTKDLAEALLIFAVKQPQGIFHCTNSGTCTWYDLACKTLSCCGMDPGMVRPVPTSAFPRPAKRPAYSVLDNSLFANLSGSALRPWSLAVEEYCQSLSPADRHQ